MSDWPSCDDLGWLFRGMDKAFGEAAKGRDAALEAIESIRMNIETQMLPGWDSSLASYIMGITEGL